MSDQGPSSSMSVRPNRLRTALPASLRRALGALACCAVLAADAAAQLKLPHRPIEKRATGGSIAPYRVCSVCQARNYTHRPSGRVDAQGRELVWCDTCRRDTPQAFSTATSTGPGIPDSASKGQLKLPRSLPSDPQPDGVPPAPPGDTSQPGNSSQPTPIAPVLPDSAPQRQGITPAAAFVLAEVAKLPSADEGTAQRAVESLLAMGPDGLAAARSALFADKTPTIVVAARVLLRDGVAADADLVVRRLRAKLPGGAGPPLLRAVVEGDPVRATPELFAALLDHPQATLRTAASRELKPRMNEAALPLLEPALVSSRSETRALALELAASVTGTRATAAVLTRLDDPNARVAAAAVAALRVRDDAGLDGELLRRAFGPRWILRPNAYAILAILEREDVDLRPILIDEHVEPLLETLGSNDPFLAGTAAAALAGIGFRSARADVSQWLDSTVVDRLVFSVSGQVFHDDHSSLVGHAVRRLRLLSGETFGYDGPAWVEWWLQKRAGFRAQRAALPIPVGAEGSIRIAAAAPERDLDVELVGPDVDLAARKVPAARRETIRLTSAQASELSAALVREGTLAADRMPGAYQSEGLADRTLEIDIQDRSKSFVVGPHAKTPWFERLVSLVASLREQNRWQVLVGSPDGVEATAAWNAQAAWWDESHTDAEHSARLGELAVAALNGPHPALRVRALDELERAQAAGALPESAFSEVLAALRQERVANDRARRLLALAIASGPSATDASGELPVRPGRRLEAGASQRLGAGASQRLGAGASQRLVDAIEESLGAGNGDLVVQVLDASEREFVRRFAADLSPVRRWAAANVLGRGPDDDDARALLTLLNDSDARVHTAAAEALGTAQVEIARDDLLSRARLAEGSMRKAALRAAGALGGPHVLDALVLGLADADVEIRRAAIDGLGRLRDPAAAQVLVNLLPEGSDAPIGESVRTAILRVGSPAIPSLQHAAEAPDGKSRRDAALLLAQLLSPDGAPPLLAIVSQDTLDRFAANELAILTCFDPRGTSDDPVNAWWTWWEGVRHDDALVWFRAGVERLGIPQPPLGALEGEGTAEGQRFLMSLLDREEPWLAERAWRELGRLTGEPLDTMPARGEQRAQWVRERRARLLAEANAERPR